MVPSWSSLLQAHCSKGQEEAAEIDAAAVQMLAVKIPVVFSVCSFNPSVCSHCPVNHMTPVVGSFHVKSNDK